MSTPGYGGRLLHAVVLLAVCWSLASSGCTRGESEESAQPAQEAAETAGPIWTQLGESTVTSTAAPDDNAALAAAIEQARATADDARARWAHSDGRDQPRWAVKWAAPLETGDVEYLWVRPEHWSRFRIEGVLLTEPVHALAEGGQRGDLVSFPAEQLVDWVHVIAGEGVETREGGYTIDALNID